METEEISKESYEGVKFSCSSCGAYLKYKPGTHQLDCEYCGAENNIAQSDETVKELVYNRFLNSKNIQEVVVAEQVVSCESCNTTITMANIISSSLCPYCATPLIVEKAFEEKIIQPKALLPFKLEVSPAKEEFKKWMRKRWFAPSNLSGTAQVENINGLYIPFWTYDTVTVSNYTGQRGIYYYVNESYTTTQGGKTVTKTRSVRKTRWHSASGTIKVFFDDLLVSGTKTLPEKYIKKLEPWDLHNLVPFDKAYLSGYVTEKYQVNIEQGFEAAKLLTVDDIRAAIRKNIGGDDQRINTVDTGYANIKFKHVLFPVYVSAYRYNNKVYQFFINARTGEVQGERPYSWIKITMAILMVIAVVVLIFYYSDIRR